MTEVNGLDSEPTKTPQLTTDEKIQKAQSLKDEGNEYFKEKDYKNAMKKYHRALLHVKGLTDQPEMLGIKPREDISEELKANIEKITCSIYNNLSACFVKQERWQKVIDYSTKVLEIQPKNTKAIFRRGQAHLNIKDYDNAEKDLKEANKLEPDDASIKRMLVKLQGQLKQVKEKERKTYKGMFDKLSAKPGD